MCHAVGERFQLSHRPLQFRRALLHQYVKSFGFRLQQLFGMFDVGHIRRTPHETEKDAVRSAMRRSDIVQPAILTVPATKSALKLVSRLPFPGRAISPNISVVLLRMEEVGPSHPTYDLELLPEKFQ